MPPESDHLRRPKPARTAPIRRFSDLLDERTASPAHERDASQASADARPSEAPGDHSLRSAVDLGYRVIDDYLKQGRRFAEDAAGQALGGGMPDAGSDIRTITDRLSRDWLLLVTRIVDAVGGLGAKVGEGASPRQPSTRPAPTAVTVWMDAPGPASVTLDLSDEAPHRGLHVQPLHGMADDAPPIREVSVEPLEGRAGLVISVRIASDQPPGMYSGVVFDEAAERPCGTLCVQLEGE